MPNGATHWRGVGLMLVVVLPMAFAQTAHAATRNVPGDYMTIQAALDASTFGDVVVVAAGTYNENIVIRAPQNGVQLRGAAGAAATILDGGRRTTVIRCHDVGPLTRIEGFTIMNGGEEPLATTLGGGISLSGASPIIQNNVIRDNYAVAAGGIYVDASSPVIIQNEIRNNHAPFGSGGGIYCDHSANPRIEGNVISGNVSAAYGGGITIWENSAPRLVSNTIAANTATLGGGGVYIVRGSNVEALRNIVSWNSGGAGIEVADEASSLLLGCSDVFGNTPADFAGIPDPSGSAGNFSANPLFCDLAGLDLYISSSSPCTTSNSPAGCDLVGALDIRCGVTAARQVTWGKLKVRYR